jgi:hypothetical protein
MDEVRSTMPVTIALGTRCIQGVVRAVGEVVEWGQGPGAPPRRLRQIVLDLGAASAPVELWLAEAEEPLRPAPSGS